MNNTIQNTGNDKVSSTSAIKSPKHYPKPEYCKCNAGHELVEIFDEKRNTFDWDCPICKAKMEKLGCFSHPKGAGQ